MCDSFTTDQSLQPAWWLPRLTGAQLGRGESRCLAETTSTNAVLKDMARRGAPHGSLCMAEHQTAGRGRLDRVWNSPAGQGLWLSVLLRPSLPLHAAPLITFCSALAMARAVKESTGLPVLIKWPNDLVCRGKKLCGILLEISAAQEGVDYVVVGTGLNVRRGAYPAELAHQATSIEDHLAPPPRGELLCRYLAALEDSLARLEQGGFEAIRADYAAACCTLGSRVHVSGATELTGVATDLDDTGALLVKTDDGRFHRVLAGDVSVRGVMGYV